MKIGYIKLFRSIEDNPLWLKEPFSKGQAWVDLLLTANHKDNKTMKGNNVVLIKRGQTLTSILKLSKRWKWSRGKTTAFLRLLSENGMISLKIDTKSTYVTICNYDKYQESQTSNRHQNDIKMTSNRHQNDTNNNNKNNKNIKKEEEEGLVSNYKTAQENISLMKKFLPPEEVQAKKLYSEYVRKQIPKAEQISINLEFDKFWHDMKGRDWKDKTGRAYPTFESAMIRYIATSIKYGDIYETQNKNQERAGPVNNFKPAKKQFYPVIPD